MPVNMIKGVNPARARITNGIKRVATKGKKYWLTVLGGANTAYCGYTASLDFTAGRKGMGIFMGALAILNVALGIGHAILTAQTDKLRQKGIY